MSLNAIQQKIRDELDGLVVVGVPDAVAWVQPPILDDIAESPRIYIWGGHLDEERYTVPRGYGQKLVKHRLDIYVVWASTNDVAEASKFVLVLDAIRERLRTMSMPVEVTDDQTGEVSVLQWVGENITQDYTTPVAIEDQRFLEHSAYLVAPTDEILSLR